MKHVGWRIFAVIFFVVGIALIYVQLQRQGVLARLTDVAQLKDWIISLGVFGPILLMGLMALAVVVNPVPSAPIALAAGAIFGHTWGTVYVVAGAAIGAFIAFWLARILGYELLSRYLGERIRLGWLGSQNGLTWMTLVSRLIPFISFDLVSYGAGLTPIKFWRFAIATIVGLIPASLLLAHFGGEMAAAELQEAMLIVLALGLLTIVPVLLYGGYKRFYAK